MVYPNDGSSSEGHGFGNEVVDLLSAIQSIAICGQRGEQWMEVKTMRIL
jgi:hypothetical protein